MVNLSTTENGFFLCLSVYKYSVLCGNWQGNFQDKEQMKIEKAVRARYGRFFYRFPNGESAADVYDRITGKGTSTVDDSSVVLGNHLVF